MLITHVFLFDISESEKRELFTAFKKYNISSKSAGLTERVNCLCMPVFGGDYSVSMRIENYEAIASLVSPQLATKMKKSLDKYVDGMRQQGKVVIPETAKFPPFTELNAVSPRI